MWRIDVTVHSVRGVRGAPAWLPGVAPLVKRTTSTSRGNGMSPMWIRVSLRVYGDHDHSLVLYARHGEHGLLMILDEQTRPLSQNHGI